MEKGEKVKDYIERKMGLYKYINFILRRSIDKLELKEIKEYSIKF